MPGSIQPALGHPAGLPLSPQGERCVEPGATKLPPPPLESDAKSLKDQNGHVNAQRPEVAHSSQTQTTSQSSQQSQQTQLSLPNNVTINDDPTTPTRTFVRLPPALSSYLTPAIPTPTTDTAPETPRVIPQSVAARDADRVAQPQSQSLVAPAAASSTPNTSDNYKPNHPAQVAAHQNSQNFRLQPAPALARGHKKNALSIESVPRQTIMKALASVARNNKPEALSLTSMLSANAPGDNGPASASSQQFCDALNGLTQAQNARSAPQPPSAIFPSLQSPCFYHNRFDDAVDIDKVLEEIKNDEWMSHSRLVQISTGVREVSKQLQRRPIRRAVKNVMIVTKARDNQLVLLTRELALWLLKTPRYGSDLGVNVYVDAKLRHSKRFNARGILDENPRFQDMLRYWTPDLCWSQPEKFDLVLTLGGDGTVLFTSWLFQRIVPPVLSFSLGSLGFLTSFEFERYKEHLNRVMGDEGMRVNLRMRFTCTVYRDTPNGHEMEEGEQFEVLNELVIDRGPSPYVSNLELYGDDELLTIVQADGIILSTPTGSTAYSLSAGGSLVHPDIPAILLTPICPHTLSFRPMVLSDTMLLRVSVPRNSRAGAYCAFDGKGRIELRQGDHVTITASQYPFPTVQRTDTEWFDSVSRTLRWNTRAATQKAFVAKTGDNNNGSQTDEDEDEGYDIDTDSACYPSEESSTAASPLRRQMSMLGL
ncbi:NAD+ kinase-like protein [Thermochaetoides thermophila DSM 1495]|uniref:NAD+ kinase-like protein n=1 Tax=Chaetomium thermophilum (strain DSM 1495 / CBS 144.50 / IMI 039719) TaxID=759272 RepID=G0SCD2_CHATD|nr:NAD+ kinase-like protein [Thermochaetoides thermophila DSM 1495]EGS19058.1 NAD+ kinase-like protein [Thermochaetoides thermophila DSM 1495]